MTEREINEVNAKIHRLLDTIAEQQATIGRLRAALAKAVAALQLLYDWQNGPPLLSKKWRDGWGDAMARANVVLIAAKRRMKREN